MEFAHPEILLLLILVPLPGLWHWWRRQRQEGLRFGNMDTVKSIPRSARAYLGAVPPILRTAVLGLLILALARPQLKNVVQEHHAEGVDIVLILDTSSSMLAQDFSPNRFEVAREVAADFIDGRQSDRIGLIVFAAKAYTQAPLTLDYGFLHRMLEDVDIGVIDDGTAIGTALATAVNRLKESYAESKVIILLTDGQNNRGEIDPVTASDVAAALGVRVYAVGVGTHGEAPFVVDHPFAGTQRQMVRVEIDEDMLRSVSSNTGGQYFRATDESALRSIYDRIGELETTRIETEVYTDYEDKYASLLWPAVALFLFEVLLTTTVLRRFP